MQKILAIVLLLLATNLQAQIPNEVLKHFLIAYKENEFRKGIITKQDSVILEYKNRDLLREQAINILEQANAEKDLIITSKDGVIILKNDEVNAAEAETKKIKKQRNLAYGGAVGILVLLILSLI